VGIIAEGASGMSMDMSGKRAGVLGGQMTENSRRTAPVPTLAIGAPVWKFDQNRREYERDEKGRASGPPIWRKHWVRYAIKSENRVNWILDDSWGDNGSRISKRDPRSAGWGFAFSEEEIDRLAWIHDNAHKLADAVRRCTDYETLHAVAALLPGGVG
jgi:hypothetical protein